MTDLAIIHPFASANVYKLVDPKLVAVEPPLWCRLIAGYIRDQGGNVEIIDAEAERLSPQAVERRLATLKPRLICIVVQGHQPSASTQTMPAATVLALQLDSAPVVIAGGHPSALPARTLRETGADYVAVGEGHLTILGLLRGDETASIPGLCWNDGNAVRVNAPAPLCENLAELHGNVWDKLPMHNYRAHNWQCFGNISYRHPYASIYTSLGCPYRCTFCCINAPFASNRYRMRDPYDVVAEVRQLYARGVTTFKITDEMFVLNEAHYTKIAQGLSRLSFAKNLNIWAYARVDTVKPETLGLLRSAGIRWLALGIESGSALVRDGANKRLKTDDIVGTVKAIQAAGINVIGNFMFGLRDDTLATMQETLDLALDCMPDFANFYSTMAYPGSALYTQALAEGWTLPENWSGYSQHNAECRPLDTAHISGLDVRAFRDSAFGAFFGDEKYRDHVRNKFGSETLAHVDTMGAMRR